MHGFFDLEGYQMYIPILANVRSLVRGNDFERSISLFWGLPRSSFWLVRLLLFLFMNDWFEMQFSLVQCSFHSFSGVFFLSMMKLFINFLNTKGRSSSSEVQF
mmetsp:Transcript_15652/g.24348  ORF Transcript_15652/g.24348 Transcript_15652/m.24348 type:complete len:103 (+) Transcript_15652:520-828(+)